jgi:hypothetical protein
LHAEYIQGKLLKFLKIVAYRQKKFKFKDKSPKKYDVVDNTHNYVWKTLNFIVEKGFVIHDYQRNPIPFFQKNM